MIDVENLLTFGVTNVYSDLETAEVLGWFTPGPDSPSPSSVPIIGGIVPCPSRYRLANGKGFGVLPDADTRDWPSPRWASVPGIDSLWWEAPSAAQDTRWGHAGWYATPRTHFGMFFGRIAEGRSMRYPWRDVLAFAWRYRNR